MVMNRLQLGMVAVTKRRVFRFLTCWCGKFNQRHPGVFMTATEKWLAYAFRKNIEDNLCLLHRSHELALFMQQKDGSTHSSVIFWWQLCHRQIGLIKPYFPKKCSRQKFLRPRPRFWLAIALPTELQPNSLPTVYFHNRRRAENVPAGIEYSAI